MEVHACAGIMHTSMIEVEFWNFAQRSYAAAKVEGETRTRSALKDNEGGLNASDKDVNAAHDTTPKVTSEQLVGLECVRFQGPRVAYFALDNKDSKVGCLLEGGGAPARRDGDYIVLNRIVSLKEDSGKAV